MENRGECFGKVVEDAPGVVILRKIDIDDRSILHEPDYLLRVQRSQRVTLSCQFT